MRKSTGVLTKARCTLYVTRGRPPRTDSTRRIRTHCAADACVALALLNIIITRFIAWKIALIVVSYDINISYDYYFYVNYVQVVVRWGECNGFSQLLFLFVYGFWGLRKEAHKSIKKCYSCLTFRYLLIALMGGVILNQRIYLNIMI